MPRTAFVALVLLTLAACHREVKDPDLLVASGHVEATDVRVSTKIGGSAGGTGRRGAVHRRPVRRGVPDLGSLRAGLPRGGKQSGREPAEAAALVWLAEEIAERVRGTEAWRNRLHGYVFLHKALVLRRSGDPGGASATLEEALRRWQAGSDPEGLLDAGALLDDSQLWCESGKPALQ